MASIRPSASLPVSSFSAAAWRNPAQARSIRLSRIAQRARSAKAKGTRPAPVRLSISTLLAPSTISLAQRWERPGKSRIKTRSAACGLICRSLKTSSKASPRNAGKSRCNCWRSMASSKRAGGGAFSSNKRRRQSASKPVVCNATDTTSSGTCAVRLARRRTMLAGSCQRCGCSNSCTHPPAPLCSSAGEYAPGLDG